MCLSRVPGASSSLALSKSWAAGLAPSFCKSHSFRDTAPLLWSRSFALGLLSIWLELKDQCTVVRPITCSEDIKPFQDFVVQVQVTGIDSCSQD